MRKFTAIAAIAASSLALAACGAQQEDVAASEAMAHAEQLAAQSHDGCVSDINPSSDQVEFADQICTERLASADRIVSGSGVTNPRTGKTVTAADIVAAAQSQY